jgi:hypothetical protein
MKEECTYSSTHSLTPALDGGEWSVSRPGRFTPRERAPVTNCIGGLLGPRACLDVVVNLLGYHRLVRPCYLHLQDENGGKKCLLHGVTVQKTAT